LGVLGEANNRRNWGLGEVNSVTQGPSRRIERRLAKVKDLSSASAVRRSVLNATDRVRGVLPAA